ncbi:hypothetical protein BKI52_32290 [marine bacterium AO1-C]|nr:hypothetical protein BKI52_32290 [marine bacterium AO1-C]
MSKEKEFLYQQLADNLQQHILQKNLLPGSKLPSVRTLSQQYQVSPSTVFSAYYYLESLGLIEAKPKSGYYVRRKKDTAKIKAYQRLIAEERIVDKPFKPTSSGIIEELEVINTQTGYINFSQAVPPMQLLPTQRFKKTLADASKNYSDQLLRYPPSVGIESLRQQIVLHAFQWGFGGDKDDVLITAGCLEALVLCLQAVVQRGDIIVTDTLTYFGIQQAIEHLGYQVIPITSDPIQGLDLDYLTQVFKKFSVKACLFVSNFHNPTGHSIPDHQKKQLAEIVNRWQIPLIENDVYGDVYFGKQRPSTIKRYDQDGWVMYCNSFSKTVAPGYRVGYCLPGRFKAEVFRQKRIHSITTSSIAQFVLSDFLQKGRYGYHLKKLRNYLHFNMIKYEECIMDNFPAQTFFSTPQGGYVLWIGFDQSIDTYELYQQSLVSNIVIIPGQVFSFSQTYKNFIRLSFATPFDEQVATAIQTLGKLAKNLTF